MTARNLSLPVRRFSLRMLIRELVRQAITEYPDMPQDELARYMSEGAISLYRKLRKSKKLAGK